MELRHEIECRGRRSRRCRRVAALSVYLSSSIHFSLAYLPLSGSRCGGRGSQGQGLRREDLKHPALTVRCNGKRSRSILFVDVLWPARVGGSRAEPREEEVDHNRREEVGPPLRLGSDNISMAKSSRRDRKRNASSSGISSSTNDSNEPKSKHQPPAPAEFNVGQSTSREVTALVSPPEKPGRRLQVVS